MTHINLLTSDNKTLTWQAYALLVLVALAFFLPGFFTLPPIDRDEALFAQATRQMVQSGDYTDIRFQDKPRYQKPIGIYWLQSAAVHTASWFNDDAVNNIAVYRLPSLVGAVVAVVATAALGAMLFGANVGLLAGLLLAGCLLLGVEARLAKTDATLLACVTVAQYALARAWLSAKGHTDRMLFPPWMAIAFWGAQGLAFLIKGPILLLITIATLVVLHVVGKRHWKDVGILHWFPSLRPWWGIIGASLIVVPWFVAIIMASGGEFVTRSAGNDMLAKIWQAQNRGIIPPGAHLLAMPLLFFPASLLALLAIPDTWRDRRDKAVLFCLAWLIPAWLMFELPLTKLPHYVMPMYPALALLAARATVMGFPALSHSSVQPSAGRKRWQWLPATAMGLWFFVGMAIAAAMIAVPLVLDHRLALLQIAAGAVLLTAMVAAAWLLIVRRGGAAVAVMLIGMLTLTTVTFAHTFPALDNLWVSRKLVAAGQGSNPCPTVPLKLVTAAYSEPSLVFLAGVNTVSRNDGAEAASDMLRDRCLVAAIDSKRLAAFLGAFPDATPPREVASVSGFNIGGGRMVELKVYVLP